MLLCITRTPPFRAQIRGKKCGLYTGKDGNCAAPLILISRINMSNFEIVLSLIRLSRLLIKMCITITYWGVCNV